MKNGTANGAACAIVVGLCLVADANAVTLTKSFTSATNITVGTTSSTSTPLFPVLPLFTRLHATPTYGMSGSVYAYEFVDSFSHGPAPKVDFINLIQAVAHSKTDTAFATGCYFGGCDSAQVTASFTGSPIADLGVGIGPISTAVMTGISGDMSLSLEYQTDAENPGLAQGLIVDPFLFTGLIDDEGVAVTTRLDAGTSLRFEAGIGEQSEIRRLLKATTDIPGLEDLYTLSLSVGAAADGSPGILVDFFSNALLSLNDSAIEQSILDAIVLDLPTSTFSLTSDILLFDDFVPRNGVSDFMLAFSDGVDLDSFAVPYVYDPYTGPTVGGDPQAVSAPPTLTLVLGALPMALLSVRRRRQAVGIDSRSQ